MATFELPNGAGGYNYIDEGRLTQTLTPGTYGPTAITLSDNAGNAWVQTLTYDTSGNLTGISPWVKS